MDTTRSSAFQDEKGTILPAILFLAWVFAILGVEAAGGGVVFVRSPQHR